MSHHALLEYIRKAKNCGASDVDVSERLHKAGWYGVDVKDALELYQKITTPKPSLTERIVPRRYDPHLIAVAAVSFVFGFLLFLWLTHY